LLAWAIGLSLRPSLAFAVVLGVLPCATYPTVRRLPKQYAVGATTIAAAAIVLIGVAQARRIDSAAHELFYRQTVSRMETLGRLYTDQPEPTQPVAFKPGTTVALEQPQSGWALGGVVQMLEGPEAVRVAFTDG